MKYILDNYKEMIQFSLSFKINMTSLWFLYIILIEVKNYETN